jgi:hypothetical protein
MPQITLNRTRFERLSGRSQEDAVPSAADPCSPPRMTRRRFMLAVGVGVAVAQVGTSAPVIAGDEEYLELSLDGDLAWAIDVSWLAGKPVLSTGIEAGRLAVTLSGARYPGTDISADFSLTIGSEDGMQTVRLLHGLARMETTAPLADWVSGAATLEFACEDRVLSCAVGRFLRVRQTSTAQVRFMPTLTLAAEAPQGWELDGREFTGVADSVSLGPAGDVGMMTSQELLLRSQMAVSVKDAAASMSPRFAPARSGYGVDPGPLASLELELAEDMQGGRHQAFVAASRGGMAVTRARDDGGPVRMLTNAPVYARLVNQTGASTVSLLAHQGQAMTPFSDSVLVSASQPGRPLLRMDMAGGKLRVDCCAYPVSLSLPEDAHVGVTIHFPWGQAAPASMICPFTLWHKEVSLDGAQVVFKRPQNALLLTAELHGFELVRTWRGLRLHAANDGMLKLQLGPQSVVEQSFYQPPSAPKTDVDAKVARARYLAAAKARYIASGADISGWPSALDRIEKEYDRDVAPEQAGDETANPPLPSHAHVSGPSTLIYRYIGASPAHGKEQPKLSLSLGTLLDPNLWQLVVVRDAASSEQVWKTGKGLVEYENRAAPPAAATFLELPGDLFISPDETTRFLPYGLHDVRVGRYKEIFRLQAWRPADGRGVPLRAIGTRDFHGRSLPENDVVDTDHARLPLELRDRCQFVWLTSGWNQPALLGTHDVRQPRPSEHLAKGNGIYVPQPFYAQTLMLSSMGGTLKALGNWDPPSFTQAGFALSVERWVHNEWFGRLCKEEVVYKSFFLPFGIRGSLIKVTQRDIVFDPVGGVLALPITRFYIESAEPTATYTETLAPHAGRTWPFHQITLDQRGRLQIDNPSDSSLCGLGQSAFKICVRRKPHWFDFTIDGDPTRKGSAALVMIDNTVAHDEAQIAAVRNAFNQSDPSDVNAWINKLPSCHAPSEVMYCMDLLESKVRYAESTRADDTAYVTTTMRVGLGVHLELVNTALLEASGKPPTYPEMADAKIVIPALNQLTGNDARQVTGVRFADVYRDYGFDPLGAGTTHNVSEVFLALTTPVVMSFAGKGERAGAVGTPNTDAVQVSRSVGLMGKSTEQVAVPGPASGGLAVSSGVESAVTFKGADLFRSDAKLLGVLPMAQLMEALDLKQVPRFIESARHQVDAALEDAVTALRVFARDALREIDAIFVQLDSELSQAPGLDPLRQHLGTAHKALNRIGKGTPEKDLEAIGDAGQALEDARRFVDTLSQHPEVLLPVQITGLIADWMSTVAKLMRRYEALRGQIQQLRAALLAQIAAAVNAVQKEAGSYVASQLNEACAAVSSRVERLVSMALSIERQLTPFTDLYRELEQTYTGWLGVYRELPVNWDACTKAFKDIASVLMNQAADRFIGLLNAALQDEASKLDTHLRAWPEAAREPARAFFRSIEPAVMELSALTVELRGVGKVTLLALSSQVDRLRRVMNTLDTAIAEELTTGLRQLGQTAHYLADAQQILNRLRRRVVQGAIQLMANKTPVLNTPVATVLATLRNGLPADSALSMQLLRATEPFVVATTDEQKLVAVAQLTGMTAAVVGRLDAAGSSANGALAEIVTLDDQLRSLITTLDKHLVDWIDDVCFKLPVVWTERRAELEPLLGPKAFLEVQNAFKALQTARDAIATEGTNVAQLPRQAITELHKHISGAVSAWSGLAAKLQRIGQAPDRFVIDQIRARLAELASRLVPAEIKLDYEFKTPIVREVAIFLPGSAVGPERTAATLSLNAHIQYNLRTGASSAEFGGLLTSFRLNLMGFLIISFAEVRFESKSGSAPKLYPPKIDDVRFDGCLSVIEGLKSFLQQGSGPYVLPLPTGIRAGVRLAPGVIPLGPMIVLDLILDVGIEIPFDDRAAITTFSVSSRACPALLFIATYGGAMFLLIQVAGDRLVSVEASFEAGLLSAFNFPAVKGNGRITLGFYFRQSGEGFLLTGFFFAGGAAQVLDIVSITASLRISLIYNGSHVTGHGEFSVRVGYGFFAWTLHYGLDYTVSETALRAESGCAQPQDRLQINRGAEMSQLFLDKHSWNEFRSAFA